MKRSVYPVTVRLDASALQAMTGKTVQGNRIVTNARVMLDLPSTTVGTFRLLCHNAIKVRISGRVWVPYRQDAPESEQV